MHLVGSDDRMFRFLDGDQIPKLVRLGDLALTNECGVRFEHTQNFVRKHAYPRPAPGLGSARVRRRWLSRRAMRIASLTTARVVAINHRGHGSGERRGDDH